MMKHDRLSKRVAAALLVATFQTLRRTELVAKAALCMAAAVRGGNVNSHRGLSGSAV